MTDAFKEISNFAIVNGPEIGQGCCEQRMTDKEVQRLQCTPFCRFRHLSVVWLEVDQFYYFGVRLT